MRVKIAACAFFIAAALGIGCWNLSNSGPLWADAPQYANAAAMIHDWLKSGDYLHPVRFAESNYARYPAFHMPYHPPAYPGIMGVFFLIFGLSSASARVFVALCLGLAACFFYLTVKRWGVGSTAAVWPALVFLTLPEAAYWTRSTMSEVPGLMLILAGTYCFATWMEEDGAGWYIAAFVLAEMAFLSRHLSVGVVPAWFIWVLLAKKWRRVFSPLGIATPTLFLAAGWGWISFSERYSVFETSSGALGSNQNFAPFSWEVVRFYATSLPQMLGWIPLLGGVLGLLAAWRSQRSALVKYGGFAWIVSYAAFVIVVGIYKETRYFLYALPAFPAAMGWLLEEKARWSKYAASVLFGAALMANVAQFRSFPGGTLGHAAIAERLAGLEERGDILAGLPLQSHLIFEYRARRAVQQRSFIRVDRTLAMRNPVYTNAPSVVLAKGTEDVIETIRRGRIRYIVVADEGASTDPEVLLLLEALRNDPRRFARMEEFPLRVQDTFFARNVTAQLWKFTGELPEGPSELPVIVPTAGLSLRPAQ